MGQGMKGGYGGHHGGGMMKGGGPGGGGGYGMQQRAEPYTADEVRTLMEARMLRHAPDTVELGEVSDNGDTVTVTIVTKDNGGLVRELEISKDTGFPVR